MSRVELFFWLFGCIVLYLLGVVFLWSGFALLGKGSPNYPGFLITGAVGLVLGVVLTVLARRRWTRVGLTKS